MVTPILKTVHERRRGANRNKAMPTSTATMERSILCWSKRDVIAKTTRIYQRRELDAIKRCLNLRICDLVFYFGYGNQRCDTTPHRTQGRRSLPLTTKQAFPIEYTQERSLDGAWCAAKVPRCVQHMYMSVSRPL